MLALKFVLLNMIKTNNGEVRCSRRQTVVDTTVGRAIFWEIVPEGFPFALINQPLGKKQISKSIE